MSQVTKRALEQSLKNLLLKKPLTKITVSDIAADCGINRNFIYDLEHGNSSPSVDKIARIAAYFGVSAAVLLGGGDGADGADGADGELHAFLALYAKLSDEDRAALRAYMRKLLESGG